ncbi:hypothetical protein THUN1379_00840 [Paludibacterium sp. THUN1379]|uniref:hypothetical protein n=1 Tax=Paludibacterium sp. THUN1379 TaxID=3112107 RepID=UPI003087AF47|nr:hypothetical protein THUN1379_00840 [Paludibacterium sp. THUN1379]
MLSSNFFSPRSLVWSSPSAEAASVRQEADPKPTLSSPARPGATRSRRRKSTRKASRQFNQVRRALSSLADQSFSVDELTVPYRPLDATADIAWHRLTWKGVMLLGWGSWFGGQGGMHAGQARATAASGAASARAVTTTDHESVLAMLSHLGAAVSAGIGKVLQGCVLPGAAALPLRDTPPPPPASLFPEAPQSTAGRPASEPVWGGAAVCTSRVDLACEQVAAGMATQPTVPEGAAVEIGRQRRDHARHFVPAGRAVSMPPPWQSAAQSEPMIEAQIRSAHAALIQQHPALRSHPTPSADPGAALQAWYADLASVVRQQHAGLSAERVAAKTWQRLIADFLLVQNLRFEPESEAWRRAEQQVFRLLCFRADPQSLLSSLAGALRGKTLAEGLTLLRQQIDSGQLQSVLRRGLWQPGGLLDSDAARQRLLAEVEPLARVPAVQAAPLAQIPWASLTHLTLSTGLAMEREAGWPFTSLDFSHQLALRAMRQLAHGLAVEPVAAQDTATTPSPGEGTRPSLQQQGLVIALALAHARHHGRLDLEQEQALRREDQAAPVLQKVLQDYAKDMENAARAQGRDQAALTRLQQMVEEPMPTEEALCDNLALRFGYQAGEVVHALVEHPSAAGLGSGPRLHAFQTTRDQTLLQLLQGGYRQVQLYRKGSQERVTINLSEVRAQYETMLADYARKHRSTLKAVLKIALEEQLGRPVAAAEVEVLQPQLAFGSAAGQRAVILRVAGLSGPLFFRCEIDALNHKLARIAPIEDPDRMGESLAAYFTEAQLVRLPADQRQMVLKRLVPKAGEDSWDVLFRLSGIETQIDQALQQAARSMNLPSLTEALLDLVPFGNCINLARQLLAGQRVSVDNAVWCAVDTVTSVPQAYGLGRALVSGARAVGSLVRAAASLTARQMQKTTGLRTMTAAARWQGWHQARTLARQHAVQGLQQAAAAGGELLEDLASNLHPAMAAKSLLDGAASLGSVRSIANLGLRSSAELVETLRPSLKRVMAVTPPPQLTQLKPATLKKLSQVMQQNENGYWQVAEGMVLAVKKTDGDFRRPLLTLAEDPDVVLVETGAGVATLARLTGERNAQGLPVLRAFDPQTHQDVGPDLLALPPLRSQTEYVVRVELEGQALTLKNHELESWQDPRLPGEPVAVAELKDGFYRLRLDEQGVAQLDVLDEVETVAFLEARQARRTSPPLTALRSRDEMLDSIHVDHRFQRAGQQLQALLDDPQVKQQLQNWHGLLPINNEFLNLPDKVIQVQQAGRLHGWVSQYDRLDRLQQSAKQHFIGLYGKWLEQWRQARVVPHGQARPAPLSDNDLAFLMQVHEAWKRIDWSHAKPLGTATEIELHAAMVAAAAVDEKLAQLAKLRGNLPQVESEYQRGVARVRQAEAQPQAVAREQVRSLGFGDDQFALIEQAQQQQEYDKLIKMLVYEDDPARIGFLQESMHRLRQRSSDLFQQAIPANQNQMKHYLQFSPHYQRVQLWTLQLDGRGFCESFTYLYALDKLLSPEPAAGAHLLDKLFRRMTLLGARGQNDRMRREFRRRALLELYADRQINQLTDALPRYGNISPQGLCQHLQQMSGRRAALISDRRHLTVVVSDGSQHAYFDANLGEWRGYASWEGVRADLDRWFLRRHGHTGQTDATGAPLLDEIQLMDENAAQAMDQALRQALARGDRVGSHELLG